MKKHFRATEDNSRWCVKMYLNDCYTISLQAEDKDTNLTVYSTVFRGIGFTVRQNIYMPG